MGRGSREGCTGGRRVTTARRQRELNPLTFDVEEGGNGAGRLREERLGDRGKSWREPGGQGCRSDGATLLGAVERGQLRDRRLNARGGSRLLEKSRGTSGRLKV